MIGVWTYYDFTVHYASNLTIGIPLVTINISILVCFLRTIHIKEKNWNDASYCFCFVLAKNKKTRRKISFLTELHIQSEEGQCTNQLTHCIDSQRRKILNYLILWIKMIWESPHSVVVGLWHRGKHHAIIFTLGLLYLRKVWTPSSPRICRIHWLHLWWGVRPHQWVSWIWH